MPEILNVDPQKADDAFYRYKMPAIVTKVEGNGNGIKTVFPNIHEVCAKLNRPPEILNKFFGLELGVLSNHQKEDNKFLVMGQRTQEEIQKKVFEFIKRFVLCKACRNPETDLTVQKKKKLQATCRSCGKVGEISPSERIFNLMLQYYEKNPMTIGYDAKKAQEEADKKKEAEQKADDEAPPVAAPQGTTITAASAPRTATNPIPVVHDFVNQTPSPSVDAIALKIHELKTEHNLKDSYLVRLVMRGLLHSVPGDKIIGTLQANTGLLHHFAAKGEAAVWVVEVLCACAEAKMPAKVPMMLKMLWEEEVIPEKAVLDWVAAAKPAKGVDAAFQAEAKAKSVGLVAWLKDDA